MWTSILLKRLDCPFFSTLSFFLYNLDFSESIYFFKVWKKIWKCYCYDHGRKLNRIVKLSKTIITTTISYISRVKAKQKEDKQKNTGLYKYMFAWLTYSWIIYSVQCISILSTSQCEDKRICCNFFWRCLKICNIWSVNKSVQ